MDEDLVAWIGLNKENESAASSSSNHILGCPPSTVTVANEGLVRDRRS